METLKGIQRTFLFANAAMELLWCPIAAGVTAWQMFLVILGRERESVSFGAAQAAAAPSRYSESPLKVQSGISRKDQLGACLPAFVNP